MIDVISFFFLSTPLLGRHLPVHEGAGLHVLIHQPSVMRWARNRLCTGILEILGHDHHLLRSFIFFGFPAAARLSGVRARESDFIGFWYWQRRKIHPTLGPSPITHLGSSVRAFFSGPSRARNMEISANAMLLEQSNCLELGPMIRCYSSSLWGRLTPPDAFWLY